MNAFVNESCEPIYPSGWVHDNTQYPDRIFTEWQDSQLAAIGIYRVVFEDTPIPEGKRTSSYTYEISGDVALATPVFEDTPRVVPQMVSKAQGKAALLLSGLLGAVDGYITSLAGDDKILASIAFNDTTEWRRNSPFLVQAAISLGITEQQLDDLFLLAESIIL